MSIYDLARPDTRDLVPYSTPSVPSGFTRLNANEATTSPYPSLAAADLNRYPEIRPDALTRALARLYAVNPENVCPVRGSSEGIDLLVRTFCRAYRDNVITMPPTFEMYGAYAGMQGAENRQVPLDAGKDFSIDWDAVDSRCDKNTKIVFICAPNNPTGSMPAQSEVLEFLERRKGNSVVVIDEAYIEFSTADSLSSELAKFENLVVLRTLSKAYALAGARCGTILGSPQLISMVAAMMSPYAISAPVTAIALDALRDRNVAAAKKQMRRIAAERDRLAERLRAVPLVERVWHSAANFLLVKVSDATVASAALKAGRILVREFANEPGLEGCLRITVGDATDTDRVVEALHGNAGETR